MSDQCTDLMTRAEAAKFLRVSVSQLAHGWGPPPLPSYKRPVMYSRRACRKWLRAQAPCFSNAAVSGGQSSSAVGTATVSPRVKQIVAERRRKRAASVLRSSGPALVVVNEESR